MMTNYNRSQKNIETLIGNSLRIGVMLSLGFCVLGGIVYLFQHQGIMPDYKAVVHHESDFAGAAPYLRNISSIVSHIFQFDGAAMVQFGVILLIATPIVRVLLSLVAFALEKDKTYIVITAIVLLVILSNMLFGIH
ncbi:MAG: DUF1634 domain-containing protein [Prevotellaceae bacterium]|jgi:uncharacterized membrane protein|nr:DUF1634 domain-containing protein [Prevotellaceae bacterium]